MQATKQILEIAFREYSLDRVYLNVLEENQWADAFYQKAGFIFERIDKNAVMIQNIWKSLKWYAVSRNSYLRGK